MLPASPQCGSARASVAVEAQEEGRRLVGMVPGATPHVCTHTRGCQQHSLSVSTGIDKIDFCGLRAVGQISSLVGLLTL